jgi:two-component system, chemotaxis family, protein-glutamate methylesterase/glutaminase
MTTKIRVLIVDDSAFARKVLREVLAKQRDIEIVGVARDGLEALEKFSELNPDVVTLDLMMPNLDGLGVLEGLPLAHRRRVLIVSTAGGESDQVVQALQRGAFDLVSKPTALATDRLYELGSELIDKVRAVFDASDILQLSRDEQPDQPVPPRRTSDPALRAITSRELLVIGTSTGGPQALARLITALPADFPLPVAAALHIPAGYTDALSRRLDEASAVEVVEADNGVQLRAGRVVIARGGSHLRLKKRGGELTGWLSNVPSTSAHFPSVDVLFESAVEQCGSGVVGLVLTGMGNDGTSGSGMIHRAGGLVLTESRSSCVVYGMPRSVVEAGYSDGDATLDDMVPYLLGRLHVLR